MFGKYHFRVNMLAIFSLIVLFSLFQPQALYASASGAADVFEDVQDDPVIYLPLVWRMEKVGTRLSILDSGSQSFPANTPFHIAHGWAVDPAYFRAGLFEFQLQVDGVYLDEDFVEWPWTPSVNDYVKYFVFNFPGGMTGEHTFTGHWLAPCIDVFDVCSDPEEVVEANTSTVEVIFEP